MNFDYMNEILPVGSVVSIRFNHGLKIMITGYGPKDESTKKIYDYIGVIYPYGFDNYDSTIIFDKDVIKKIYFIGYSNDDSKKVCEDIKNILKISRLKSKQD